MGLLLRGFGELGGWWELERCISSHSRLPTRMSLHYSAEHRPSLFLPPSPRDPPDHLRPPSAEHILMRPSASTCCTASHPDGSTSLARGESVTHLSRCRPHIFPLDSPITSSRVERLSASCSSPALSPALSLQAMRLPLPLPSLLLAAALSPALTSALPSYDLEARDGGIIARKHSSSGGGKATGGAVATEAAPCSEIGIEILKQGGSAADAVSG